MAVIGSELPGPKGHRQERSRCEVLHLTTAHPAIDSRIHHREAVSLAQAGYRVTIVGRAEDSGARDGVQIEPLPRYRSRLARAVLGSISAFRVVVRHRPMLVHFHDPELVPLGLVLAMLFRRLRVVYDVHEDLPRQVLSKDWLPQWARAPLCRIIDVTEPLLARRFDLVITASAPIADRFRRCRVLVIRNLPVPEEYSVLEPRVSPSGPPANGRQPVVAAYVGALTRERGAVEMVKAVGLCDPALSLRLLLAGEVQEADLLDELSSLKGWEATTYLGPVRPAEVAPLLVEASLGLAVLHPIPRFQASYPTKLFEYWAAGIPVVVSDFPPWRAIIEEERCGAVVDPLNVEEIAGCLAWLATHRSDAREMGTRGRALVQRCFSWRTEAASLIDHYDSMLLTS